MTQEHTDLRVRRTHKLLRDALVDLMAQRSFDAITVGEIAQRAMVNRATFYRHYQDKYDLVASIFEEAVNTFCPIRRGVDLGPPIEAPDSLDLEHPPQIWVRVFEHFAEYSKLYRAMLGRSGSPWFAARMRDHFESVVWERRVESEMRMPEEVAIAFAANVFVGSVAWWLENEKPYAPQQMATWFLRFALQGYPPFWR